MSESTTLKPAQKSRLEQMVLRRPRHINLNMLRQALLEEDIFLFMGLMNPFLEATMSQGGISTETFKAAFGPDLTDPDFFTKGKEFTEEFCP